MSLQSGEVMIRPRVTPCKITFSVIASVEAREKTDGVKTKKFNRKKRVHSAHTC